MRRRSLERRVVGLVGEARLAVGEYGREPITECELKQLLEVFNLSATVAEGLSVPALLFPPVGGKYRLALQEGLSRDVRRYVYLHELAHVLAGEAAEPMQMIFDGPLPESEDMCDLFALLGIIDPAHEAEGASWLEDQIREAVPLDNRGWQVHRIPRLARRLPGTRKMVLNRLG